MHYIISTHGEFVHKRFIVPYNVEIRFYVRHSEEMDMGDGYRYFRTFFLNHIPAAVEVRRPTQISCDYLLTKAQWNNLIIGNVYTQQNVNGVFEIPDRGLFPQILNDMFDVDGHTNLSDIAFALSQMTDYAIIHCLFCRS